MRIEKRITRNTRKINSLQRQVEMLREEVASYEDTLDECLRRIEILWITLKEDK